MVAEIASQITLLPPDDNWNWNDIEQSSKTSEFQSEKGYHNDSKLWTKNILLFYYFNLILILYNKENKIVLKKVDERLRGDNEQWARESSHTSLAKQTPAWEGKGTWDTK